MFASFIHIANLNDRSLLGGRDSEIAVIIEDAELLVILTYLYVCSLNKRQVLEQNKLVV